MRRLTLRTSNVLGRKPPIIPFSTEELQATLLRLQNEWETVQASRDRDAIYGYLTAVFQLVEWWAKEGKAIKRAYRAQHPGRCNDSGVGIFVVKTICVARPRYLLRVRRACGVSLLAVRLARDQLKINVIKSWPLSVWRPVEPLLCSGDPVSLLLGEHGVFTSESVGECW
jgi:hypothetical protein